MLAQRQPDLTVVLENVHDPHNVSAILRSCDGVGVLQAHAVYSIEEPPPGMFARQTSASAAKWVDVETPVAYRLLPAITSGWFRHSGHQHRAKFAPSLRLGSHGANCVGPSNEMRGVSAERETWPTGQSRSMWSVWWRA